MMLADDNYFCKCCLCEVQASSSNLALVVYTDGACFGNGQDGAVAGIGVFWADDHYLNMSMELEGRPTNQRAEIQAAVTALLIAKEKEVEHLIIVTDSDYVYKGATEWIPKWVQNGWQNRKRKPVVNCEDWQQLNMEQKRIAVEWRHVYRGSCYGNIQADKLAKQGAEMAKQSIVSK